MDIIELITIAKYLVIGIGAIGILMIGIGAFRKQQELIQRGALILIAGIILFICGYFIIDKTIDRVSEIGNQYYNY